MTAITHDIEAAVTTPSARPGLGLALTSAASFGMSGSLAAGLMDAGWSAAAAVTARVAIAAVVLAVPAALAMRGRWGQVVRELDVIVAYGVVAVAGCQFAYFNAVRHMDVGMALLIEYLSPVLVVLWLWLRRGHRPGPRTVAGGLLALVGLTLVLNLFGGVHPSRVGVAWAMVATVGAAVYFMLSDVTDGPEDALAPIVLAAGGLVVGALALGIADAVGALDFRVSSRPVDLMGARVDVWVPVVALGVITAAIAYVTGIAATRRLGARLASFIALFEVLFALVCAWLLLDQVPLGVQFAGAALVLAGVVLVKLGENDRAAVQLSSSPKPATTSRSAPS